MLKPQHRWSLGQSGKPRCRRSCTQASSTPVQGYIEDGENGDDEDNDDDDNHYDGFTSPPGDDGDDDNDDNDYDDDVHDY